MKISDPGRLNRIIRRINASFVCKAVILMYHRIAEVGIDPWGNCVKPQHFAEHLEAVQKYARPISLNELAQACKNGNIPDRAVAITFDDGYADNFLNAKPLLERYNIPATVFITTGYIGQNREFWSDELERILLQPGTLPDELCLRINGSSYKWQLGPGAQYSESDYQKDRNCRAWEGRPGSRLAFYYYVWEQLASLPESQQKVALDEIRDWSGTKTKKTKCRSAYRPLNLEELRLLVQGDLVEAGAHTVTHSMLSAHTASYQWNEIQKSKAYLEDALSRPITSFAYPYGKYGPETQILVQRAGFSCSCSIVAESVRRISKSFELPRFAVEDCDGRKFAYQLSRWFRS